MLDSIDNYSFRTSCKTPEEAEELVLTTGAWKYEGEENWLLAHGEDDRKASKREIKLLDAALKKIQESNPKFSPYM
jgi:hypothetical protein